MAQATKMLCCLTLLALPACSILFNDSASDDDGGVTPDGSLVDEGTTPPTDGGPELGGTDASPILPLKDRGLLARYYMDEASTGQSPSELIDSSPAALHLPITYASSLRFDQEGGRGLAFPTLNGDGRAQALIGGTSVGSLKGTRSGTLEVVVRVTESTPTVSAIVHIGKSGQEGALSMWTDSGTIKLGHQDSYAAEWSVPTLNERTTLHLVVDSTEASASARSHLYVNGTEVAANQSAVIGDSIIFLPGSPSLVIGNDVNGALGLVGKIYYVAIYAVPLGATEVTHNAQILAASDDQPE